MASGLAITHTHTHRLLNTLLSDAQPLENVIVCFQSQRLLEDTAVLNISKITMDKNTLKVSAQS